MAVAAQEAAMVEAAVEAVADQAVGGDATSRPA